MALANHPLHGLRVSGIAKKSPCEEERRTGAAPAERVENRFRAFREFVAGKHKCQVTTVNWPPDDRAFDAMNRDRLRLLRSLWQQAPDP
jgi:hypothetical protein